MRNFQTGEKLLIVYNANENSVNFALPAGNWDLYINGEQAGNTVIADDIAGGVTQKISGLSCYVYKLDVKA